MIYILDIKLLLSKIDFLILNISSIIKMSAKNRCNLDEIARLKILWNIDFEAIYKEEAAKKNKKINSKNNRGTCTILKKFNKSLDIPMNNNLLDIITNYIV